MSEKPYRCIVCGEAFGQNPRTSRWLSGTLPPAAAPSANMCWVCNRLTVHADREAKETAVWMGEQNG